MTRGVNTIYSNTYDKRYIEKGRKDIFFDAQESYVLDTVEEDTVGDLEPYFMISVNYYRLMRMVWMMPM